GQASVTSGGAASFPLLLTPQGGFTGPVALTCTAVSPAPNASCSLLIDGMGSLSAPAADTAQITTVSGLSASLATPLGASLASLLFCAVRRRRPMPRALSMLVGGAALAGAWLFTGCGGGPGSTGNPYTPAGTYTYQVTARSTDGTALTSSVTLTLVVQ
ncbi:MAG TPA: hypothetical protein VKV02_14365, partial [Acidobacteriaceae bacterium]|nr:hypothetical protein [Acidobacteriaceae bacterium]